MAIQIKLGELVVFAAQYNMIQHTSGMNLNKDNHKRKCLSVSDFFFVKRTQIICLVPDLEQL